MLLAVLIAVPLVAGVGVFFLGKRRITILELFIQLNIVIGLIVAGYFLFRWAGIQDYETWNGRIADKGSGSSSCCHSYDCNCRDECTGTGTEQTCSRVCDTCYEHANDYAFYATSTNGEEVYYSGCHTSAIAPDAYQRIRIGEPTAYAHRFTNYVLADPEELIEAAPDLDKYRDQLPKYPEPVGWHAYRFLFADMAHPDAQRLDDGLDELNADLGAAKQVNAIVVVTKAPDAGYFDALRAHWLGGKKNDVVLVIGVPEYPTISWARVMAWNKSKGAEDEFKGGLARRIEALDQFDGDNVLLALRDEISRGYERRPFSELEYLLARAKPPVWAVIVLFSVGTLLSALLSWLFWRNRRRMRGKAPHQHVAEFFRKLARGGGQDP